MNALAVIGIRILEVMFAVGWIGSLLVVLLAGIEDLSTIFSHEEEPRRNDDSGA
jgi:hypothetical protein